MSQETVRSLCRDGALPGAFQSPKTRRRQIPAASVEALAPRQAGASAELPGTPFWQKVLAVGAIVAILAGIAGFLADSLGVLDRLATATPPPASWTLPTCASKSSRPAWRPAVDACRLLTSPAYHLLRRWHGLPPLPYLGQQLAYIRDDPNLAYV